MTTPFARWQSLIQVAPNDAAVIALVRRYLGTLSEDEFQRVPRACRPTLPTTREEVSSWAVEMVRTEMTFSGDSVAAALLHQMAVVFSEAATRFAQLAQEARMLGPSSEQ
jgi:hypothetical protein